MPANATHIVGETEPGSAAVRPGVIFDPTGERAVVDDGVGNGLNATAAREGVGADEQAPAGRGAIEGIVRPSERINRTEEQDEGRDEPSVLEGVDTEQGRLGDQVEVMLDCGRHKGPGGLGPVKDVGVGKQDELGPVRQGRLDAGL